MRERVDRIDCHEPHFERARFEADVSGVALRRIVRVRTPRSLHDELHANCEPVPVPDHNSLEYIVKRMGHPRDVVDGVEIYSRLAEKAAQRPYVTDIQQTILGLSVEAVRQQLPYLKEMVHMNEVMNLDEVAQRARITRNRVA